MAGFMTHLLHGTFETLFVQCASCGCNIRIRMLSALILTFRTLLVPELCRCFNMCGRQLILAHPSLRFCMIQVKSVSELEPYHPNSDCCR